MIALKPVLSAWLEEAEAAKRDPEGGNGVLPPGEKKRKRTSIAAPEKRSLEAYFAVQPRPSGEKIAAIAEKLDLKKNVVRVWFCNQRQKQKRMKFAAQAGLWGHSEAGGSAWPYDNGDYGDFYNTMMIKKECDNPTTQQQPSYWCKSFHFHPDQFHNYGELPYSSPVISFLFWFDYSYLPLCNFKLTKYLIKNIPLEQMKEVIYYYTTYNDISHENS